LLECKESTDQSQSDKKKDQEVPSSKYLNKKRGRKKQNVPYSVLDIKRNVEASEKKRHAYKESESSK
jgi:hypothetical protein